jgi:LCP family protein required for cell wall assembly
LVLASVGLTFNNHNTSARIVIGKTHRSALADASIEPELPEPTLPPQLRASPLLAANGYGNGDAAGFRGAVDVPDDLEFFLIVGSDARPGEDVLRSRADSIHIAAVDPLAREGTVLGLPRDSYVDVPGHGRRKINSALALGGPDLLVRTIHELTGFPISYWCVTAFDGIVKITNTLGGVDVKVPYRIDDRYSGARFEPGWHHMNGQQVLAFSRARHGVPGGDLGRSMNQGRVILHALEKMRHETKSESGIRRWLNVLYSYARLDMSIGDAVKLGVLARHIVPSDLSNVVARGTPQSMDGQSVVVLDDSAYALFREVGADAQADGDETRSTPRPTPNGSSSPTNTGRPAPTPTPTPTPVPGILPHL